MTTTTSINDFVFITLESFDNGKKYKSGKLAVAFDDYNIGDNVIFRADIKPVAERLVNGTRVLRFSKKSIYLIISYESGN